MDKGWIAVSSAPQEGRSPDSLCLPQGETLPGIPGHLPCAPLPGAATSSGRSPAEGLWRA